MSRIEIQRQAVMARLATAARVPLAESGGVTPQLIEDVCRQVGVHPHSFRALFPDDDAFLDAVTDQLVEDCAARLRGGVAAQGVGPGKRNGLEGGGDGTAHDEPPVDVFVGIGAGRDPVLTA